MSKVQSELPQGFFQHLRKLVKNKASNNRLHQYLNDVYLAGYRQALKDTTGVIQNAIKEHTGVADANEIINHGDNTDRVGGEPDSPVLDESGGVDATYTNSSEGSSEPTYQHVFDAAGTESVQS